MKAKTRGTSEMNETGTLAAKAREQRVAVLALLESARRLRKKAEKLEKESDRVAAAAARDLAEYLEQKAADYPGR